ncbi:DUF6660 family protein [Flavobacterium noncentrifugens]|uniref:Lipoprotein n=1 Tax=Flavobacterium noncentrifugens TaxID=1128970 RepID=A0A1G8ZPW5_9FLAO|nr:DUF6660 family protein [Flavobacterium noncentrifugens]SDK17063.1 hypothetical protein SAMN04487935_2690 [Flavobacterium noncentrifugens]
MKWIAILLSLYISLLACKPCADGETISGNSQSIALKKATHSHENQEDSCSPFCICSCCGVQIFHFAQPVVYHFATVLPVIKTQIPFYKTSFISGYFGSVWQPPQIA